MDRPVRHARPPGPRLLLVLGCGIAAVLAAAVVAVVVAGTTGGGSGVQDAVEIERVPDTATPTPKPPAPTATSTSTPAPAPSLEEEQGDLSPASIQVAGEQAVPPVEPEATVTSIPDAPVRSPVSAPPPPAPGSIAGVSIYSNGDSTSYFMSAGLLQMAAGLGAVQVQPAAEYHQSSGLSTPSYFDWYGYMASEMATYNPQVVVFMAGANEAWLDPETYRPYVARMMDQLQGRQLIWVGQPNMGREDLAASLPGINAVFQQEAAKRPWVRFVDTWAITSDANGAYTPYLPDADGNLVLARADDGVHVTPAGGYVLARAVLAAIADG